MRSLTLFRVLRRTFSIIGTLPLLIFLSVQACASWAQSPDSRSIYSHELPTPVVTATASMRDVPVYLKSVGTVVASKTAFARGKIRGRLTEVDFTAGQQVRAGDILARLDSRLCQEQLDRWIAQWDRDQALTANKFVNPDLYLDGASHAQTPLTSSDAQKAQVNLLNEIIKADEARVARARSLLSSTEIRSPITGVPGKPLYHVGDVIIPADNKGLVVISQVEPISVVFTLPEIMLPAVQPQMLNGFEKVRAYGADKLHPLALGHLVLVDKKRPQIRDKIELEAMFPNRDHALSPGMLVEIELQASFRRDALSIPVSAVQHSHDGTYFSYIVTEHQKAHIRPISISTITNGFAVVRGGLWPGDIVVTDGWYQLTEGRRVVIVDGPSPQPLE